MSDDNDDRDYETDTIRPDQDIDVSHTVDMLRMERMSDDCVYLAGYTDDENGADYRYWLICDDDGLRIDTEYHSEGI